MSHRGVAGSVAFGTGDAVSQAVSAFKVWGCRWASACDFLCDGHAFLPPDISDPQQFVEEFVSGVLRLLTTVPGNSVNSTLLGSGSSLFQQVLHGILTRFLTGGYSPESPLPQVARTFASAYGVERRKLPEYLGIDDVLFESVLSEFQKKPAGKRDCFVCCFSTGGDPWAVAGVLPKQAVGRLCRYAREKWAGVRVVSFGVPYYQFFRWRDYHPEYYVLLPSFSPLVGLHRVRELALEDRWTAAFRLEKVEDLAGWLADSLAVQWVLLGADYRTGDLWRFLASERLLVDPGAVLSGEPLPALDSCFRGCSTDIFRRDLELFRGVRRGLRGLL